MRSLGSLGILHLHFYATVSIWWCFTFLNVEFPSIPIQTWCFLRRLVSLTSVISMLTESTKIHDRCFWLITKRFSRNKAHSYTDASDAVYWIKAGAFLQSNNLFLNPEHYKNCSKTKKIISTDLMLGQNSSARSQMKPSVIEYFGVRHDKLLLMKPQCLVDLAANDRNLSSTFLDHRKEQTNSVSQNASVFELKDLTNIIEGTGWGNIEKDHQKAKEQKKKRNKKNLNWFRRNKSDLITALKLQIGMCSSSSLYRGVMRCELLNRRQNKYGKSTFE